MQAFVTSKASNTTLCGKVIVATDESQRPALHDIYARGQANGVDCEIIDKVRLDEIEPHTAGEAIYVPEAASSITK